MGPASISFNDVDIVTPRGEAVCTGLNCVVQEGESLMVTGINASGKTSLARLLAGLWQQGAGSIMHNFPPEGFEGRQNLFVLPQRIYMTLGNLSDQITVHSPPWTVQSICCSRLVISSCMPEPAQNLIVRPDLLFSIRCRSPSTSGPSSSSKSCRSCWTWLASGTL